MSLRNWEIAVYSLFLQGGASSFVHTEDIAVKCHELFPAGFSWVRYPAIPDKDIVRVALTDARKEKFGELVRGRSGRGHGQTNRLQSEPMLDGWQLTEAGTRWVLLNEERLSASLSSSTTPHYRQEVQVKVARLRKHELFRQFMDQPQNFVPSIGALADLLRCRVDAETEVWRARIESMSNQARIAEQEDVVRFLEACRNCLQALREAES